MTDERRRLVARILITIAQWLALTIALGALVVRSDTTFELLVTPHFGSAPMFIGAFVAAALLGATVDSIKALAPMLLLMCLGAASFIGLMNYAPVIDDVLIRTNALDNFIAQRVVVITILLTIVAIPGAAAGSLLGSVMDPRGELFVSYETTPNNAPAPWWERREKK
jgi:hypothetical protein